MRTVAEPIIGKAKSAKAFTQVTYFPDFPRFGLKGYTDDILSQYMKYIIDTAILTKVKVYFNDELIPVNNLLSYSKLFDSPTDESIYIKHGNSEVVLSTSNEFEAITFVNGIFTKLGGTHLDAWSEELFRPIMNKLNGKKDKPALSIKDVKQVFRIFIVCTVSNPSFESQSKNKLESPKVVAEVKSADINKIWKWSVISDLQDIIKSKEMVALKKSEKKKKGYVKIEGLDNANLSGTKNSHLCSLILCEGLSAKTYAIAGIEKGVYGYNGRDYFGVLSLTGKVLNCRNANLPVISKNKVITNLIQALGLQFETDYMDDKNYKTLAYGRVILLTDADCDNI
jgi:DNA topoisomerase-2